MSPHTGCPADWRRGKSFASSCTLTTMTAEACVVIPCLNGEGTLGSALKTLNQQTVRRRLRVIVVDNGSTDRSVEIASELADEVHTQSTPGSYAARNLGLSLTTESVYLSLDADCSPCTVHWAEAHLDALHSAGQEIAGSAGPLYPTPTDDWWASRADVTPHAGFVDGVLRYAVGANLAMRTEILQQVGGFPPFKADDAALGERLRTRGFGLCWVAEAGVFHRNLPGARSYFRQMRKVGWYASEADPEAKSAKAYGALVAKGIWWVAKECARSGPREGKATALKVAGQHAGYWDYQRSVKPNGTSATG